MKKSLIFLIALIGVVALVSAYSGGFSQEEICSEESQKLCDKLIGGCDLVSRDGEGAVDIGWHIGSEYQKEYSEPGDYTLLMDCGAGDKVLSGGCGVKDDEVVTEISSPTSDGGWRCRFRYEGPALSIPRKYEGNIVCAKVH